MNHRVFKIILGLLVGIATAFFLKRVFLKFIAIVLEKPIMWEHFGRHHSIIVVLHVLVSAIPALLSGYLSARIARDRPLTIGMICGVLVEMLQIRFDGHPSIQAFGISVPFVMVPLFMVGSYFSMRGVTRTVKKQEPGN